MLPPNSPDCRNSINEPPASPTATHATVADVAGLVLILATTITLAIVLGPTSGLALGAAGGFAATLLRLWLRR
ncbi:hypothetical protein [Nocardia fluminea]|uniref:hypothetical protein n=1 Tax=Nocardia fluminea TaxID=134984 RepID=UPI003657E851